MSEWALEDEDDPPGAPAGASGGYPVAGAVSEQPGASALPRYWVPGDGLEMGASLANGKCWVQTRGNGDVESLFSVDAGLNVYGALAVRYVGAAQQPSVPGQRASATLAAADPALSAYMPLLPEGPGEVELHPAYQRRTLQLPGHLEARETIFVPRTAGPERSATYDGAVVYQVVELHNRALLPQQVFVFGYAQVRGHTPADVRVRFAPHIRQGALVSQNATRGEWVRIYGAAGDGIRLAAYGSTFDTSQVYHQGPIAPLESTTEAEGDVIAALQVQVDLAPGERQRFAFVATFSATGEPEARRLYAHAWDFERALHDTIAYYTRVVGVCEVLTPDPVIDEGVIWAKANMLRVMADYPQARAFTNDPGRSSNVVGRDAAWFISGCDYLLPAFSRELLDALASRQSREGKIPEYFDAVTGEIADYGLNINDNTPLFLVAAEHYCRATGDLAYARSVYPAAARAARYLLSQLDTHLPDTVAPSNRGLVYCTARGLGTHGIAGWRNIIADYAINGAVTEINAVCVGALRAADRLARDVGRPEAEALELRQAAEDLRAAINRHLLNPENGMYYLNIDVDDNYHTDVTADELFPVMFGVAPDDVAYRIVSRLLSPDFWTTAGIRTVSRRSLEYSAFEDVGLRGGVWPGVTWWLAIAAGRYHPRLMVSALRASFEHYARDPRTNNTVPGQFGEWFDGESLVNRGMRLSPWEPPRFLWAAVEGVCGVTPLSTGRLRVRPQLPDDWKWVAVRRLPCHGQERAFFAARQGGALRFYSTVDLDVEQAGRVELFAEDVTPRVEVLQQGVHVVALRRAGGLTICVGSTQEQPIVVPLRQQGLLDPARRYDVAIYNSERDAWELGHAQPALALHALSLTIEGCGFRILSLQEQA